jgi:hypothetical protein
MPTIERFFSARNVLTTKRYLPTTSIVLVSVLLLGYYLRRGDHSLLTATQNGSDFSLLRDQLFPKVSPRLPASAFEFPLYISARGKKFWPGIRQPSTQAAEQADLSEGAEVIGVCVDGRARAYWVGALSGEPAAHVVNDVLAGSPVTVAYCDYTRCSCAFTSTALRTPLDVGVSGWKKDMGLLLSISGVNYALEELENRSQPKELPLPYQRIDHERTTWGRWVRAHPDTDVYLQAPTIECWPGIRQPPTLDVEHADLKDDAEVIGVCVGGRARAYSVDSLSGDPAAHVVNDVLAGRPVTVVHCDFMRCTRVFTSAGSSVPLDVGMGGWDEAKGMILSVGGAKYALKDGANLTDREGPSLSYQRMEHERTTWGRWRRVHPDTDVYILPPPCS